VTLPATTGDSARDSLQDNAEDSVLAGAPEPAGAGVRSHQ